MPAGQRIAPNTPAIDGGGLETRVRFNGVATDRTSAAELRAAGAQTVIENLTDASGRVRLVTADEALPGSINGASLLDPCPPLRTGLPQ
jgi:hypothetical protein